MKSIYIETSALFKIFVEDPSSEHAERLVLLAKQGKVRLVMANWVINEAVELINQNLAEKRITPKEVQRILSELADMIEGKVQYSHFTFFAITEHVIVESRLTMRDLRLKASDALHVYIAHKSGCGYFLSAKPELVERLFDAKTLEEGDLKLEAFNVERTEDVQKLFKLLAEP